MTNIELSRTEAGSIKIVAEGMDDQYVLEPSNGLLTSSGNTVILMCGAYKAQFSKDDIAKLNGEDYEPGTIKEVLADIEAGLFLVAV